ncbi:2-hydroxyacyl-CoA dehydratase subunit D [Clostridium tyrobutyricum]|uniref:(R)-2-hydroxyglutaryl-CoA dehydratase subunit alpha n=1 Tax=Clostridium tyrobutyricum TaxID=1519 RepID=A0A0A7HFM1_CLOTY|nr:2-hydroxyacyl-CoA dehydratase family protein [Clostridium tyrobutyricum]AIZ03669.1 (R)-2-hydroxyglutaryl-CoA dehydratase subunit alpha [Clostridium tyrobutyricum]MBV4415687.1 2-hydroxyacyl-CoA dehydratase family protein [Clostridium tyrobutyricum]
MGKSKAMQMCRKIISDGYEQASKAKKNGELVGWATSIFPQEIPEAFGINVVYPENHAAAVSAKHGSLDLCETAESKGYSNDICSYARVNLGYMYEKQCESLNIPEPDFILCCTNLCNTVEKWYENLAKHYNIPLIMIDTPYNVDYEVTREKIDYIKGQFEEAIKQLEKITGKKFDENKFKKIMDISSKAGSLWKEAMSLAKNVPSPMGGFDLFNYMAIIVCARGKQETVDTFTQLVKELKENAANGETTFRGEEKYRIMYDGIPCWNYLSYKLKLFTKYGINMVGSAYLDTWAIQYESGDLDGMAKAYSALLNNINIDRLIDSRTDVIKKFKCNGAVYHMNRSCKIMDFLQYELARKVEENTGVPYTRFDGDQSDPRNFTKAQFETRIQGLAEIMESNKKQGGNENE